jgi:hypothetical protein
VIPRRGPQLVVVGCLRQVVQDIHDRFPFIVAAIVDGLPFALTTNGGSSDGHLRHTPALTRDSQEEGPLAQASSRAEAMIGAVFREERHGSSPR